MLCGNNVNVYSTFGARNIKRNDKERSRSEIANAVDIYFSAIHR